MNIDALVGYIADNLWGWPFLSLFVTVGFIVLFALDFAPFRFFITAWRLVFAPESRAGAGKGDQMSALQAFINSLGTAIGNGSIAGVATGIAAGGPGAVFWMFMAGFLAMALRFAEVYLGTYFIGKFKFGNATGGPMLYLSRVPGGMILPYAFAFLCFLFSLTSGNAVQSNSIALGLSSTWSFFTPWLTALVMFLFTLYVLFGGAQRIISLSDKLVPFKVFVFLISSIIVMVYHAGALIPAIKLIIYSAFNTTAFLGGAVGITIQQAIRFGLSRGVFANEGGLGTAAVLFGSTEGKHPVKESILSMLGVFITTHIIGTAVALPIIASGVWDNGKTSTALTISAFETVFGQFGGWVITFSAVSFGLSVIVSYAYVGRECWKFLSGGRWLPGFMVIYSLATFAGALMHVKMVWDITEIINFGMLMINLFAILWLLGVIRKGVKEFISEHK